MNLQRRTLLARFAALGTTLATAGATASCAKEQPANPAANPVHFSDRERAFIVSLAAAVVASDAYSFPDPAGLDMPGKVAEFVASLDPEAQELLRTGFKILDWASVIVGWRLTRFVGLSRAEARAYLNDCLNGHQILRAVASACIQIIQVTYWGDERTWPAVGYSGPTSSAVGIPLLGISPLPLESSEP